MVRDLKDYQVQYSKHPYENYQIQFRKRKFLSIIEKYKHDTILEVGCGYSSIFKDLQKFKTMVVVEPNEVFCAQAIKDSDESGRDGIIIVNDLLENAGKELSKFEFDFIIISCLFHEIHDQRKFLSALHPICSNKTVVHISVPNARSFHRLLAVQMGLIEDEKTMSPNNIRFQQNCVFDIESLEQIILASGFILLESGSYSIKPFTHLQMQKMIDCGHLTPQMLEGLYKMEKFLPGMGSEIYVNIKNA